MMSRVFLFVFLYCFVSSAMSEIYRFGVTPWQKGQTEDDINHNYRLMVDYLGEKTGDKYIIVSARDYQQMIEFLADGKVDFASISPVPYVLAKQMNPGIQLLVTEMSWDKAHENLTDSYLGFFVTKKSRGDINSLTDLKYKRFGFVKKESSSGFKYPNALLKEKGMDYRTFFSRHYFLGSHPRVTDAIAAGSIDAGATWDFNLNQAIAKHGDIFKIVFTTPPIPNLCIAAHSSLPLEKVEKIRQALTSIDTQLLEGLPASGYVVRPDSFYDVVRNVTLEQ
ncbi:hypothetical protein A9Q99_07000 [Gammaproteobacteria bacterium 45_16_T64]|nr:hypothetical protein A9Q99_07000 [Gammaproteobacteria bacterium 45_16_T64]